MNAMHVNRISRLALQRYLSVAIFIGIGQPRSRHRMILAPLITPKEHSNDH